MISEKRNTGIEKLVKFFVYFRNLQSYSKENIIQEIILSTIAECVDETNVDRNSLLIDTDYFLIGVVRNRPQYGRPSVLFSLR